MDEMTQLLIVYEDVALMFYCMMTVAIESKKENIMVMILYGGLVMVQLIIEIGAELTTLIIRRMRT
jgi:hypothetical protein